LWSGIQDAFKTLYGPPQGYLTPLAREKVHPKAVALQGRGCLAACLLQMGVEFNSYSAFVQACTNLLLQLFPKTDERAIFLDQLATRRMEFEVS
jgi:hypothetical protein